MRAGRRSAIGSDGKLFNESAQRQLISVGAKATDDRQCGVSESRSTSLRLTRVDVREMDFDERDLYSRQRIANRETGVAICARVHECAVSPTAEPLNGIYDLGPLNNLLKADGQPQVSP